eukprot:1087152-Prymnesium_polylepis.1
MALQPPAQQACEHTCCQAHPMLGSRVRGAVHVPRPPQQLALLALQHRAHGGVGRHKPCAQLKVAAQRALAKVGRADEGGHRVVAAARARVRALGRRPQPEALGVKARRTRAARVVK